MVFEASSADGEMRAAQSARPKRLRTREQDVVDCEVDISAERADDHPKVFTKIHMHFTVKGKGIPASAIERAVAMSHEKYCSASIMLAKTAEMTTSFEVLEA